MGVRIANPTRIETLLARLGILTNTRKIVYTPNANNYSIGRRKTLTSEDHTQQNDETESYREFVISEEQAARIGAALPLMIAGRLGYMDRQALEEEPTPDSDIQPYIDLIVASSGHDADYLLPDTPLKEALFRLILANGNQPMTADQISQTLTQRWAMSAYPRNLTPHVINRILENSGNYCIIPLQPTPPTKRHNHHSRSTAPIL